MTSSSPLGQMGRRSFLAGTAATGVAALASQAASARVTVPQRYATIDDWIARESIRFSLDKNFDGAVDRLMARLGDVDILGFGEPLHSGEEFLVVRNRLFQRLVEKHGFRAITIETNDMRARLIDDYIQGRGTSFKAIEDEGFSVGIGHWERNRDLIAWLKRYNDDPAHKVKLNLYGTLASDQETTKSPRDGLTYALAYLDRTDPDAAAKYRNIVDPLLGSDKEWEETATARAQEIMKRIFAGDENAIPPTTGKELGVSPRAQGLRLAVENLIFEFKMRRPEFVGKTDMDSFRQALRHLVVARNLLLLHAAAARGESLDRLVSMRDAMAAEHLAWIAEREQGRGKIMVFLHSIHLRRTRAKLPWYEFLPTGAHLDQMFGDRFAVVAGAVGESEANTIDVPEAGSLEGRLMAQGSDLFLPTGRSRGLPPGALAALPPRKGSAPNIPYTPLSPQSVADYDAITFLRSVTVTRGLAPMPG
ncbi:erythromycin esterase family protein [Sphingosinicella rhizophila]|uniref:Erythromycin esterase family protein n=1 Tax=Sphingosinicella rhizophila TaxID=3050082 RepID=A0ABU3Q5N9_9SPHN|nr:erythromycin esterase family protein [Sphingosinicella sp. GR2756]MDT9598733.1 erythromycin esterase family protein [Sphingosinicella sp. GR2756]